ncbi:hypothetical protein E2320_000828, partial [Naja naja]
MLVWTPDLIYHLGVPRMESIWACKERGDIKEKIHSSPKDLVVAARGVVLLRLQRVVCLRVESDGIDALPELMWEMEQQLGLLRLYGNEKACGEAVETDSWPSSGMGRRKHGICLTHCPPLDSSSSIPSASGSYSRIGHPESRLGYSNERPKSV